MEPFIPATFDPEEKNDGESSDKLNDGSETGGEADQFSGAATTTTEEASTSSYVDTVASEQGFPTLTQDTGGKPVSPSNSGSTTINLQERARERAHIRQSGIDTSSLSRPRVRLVRGRGRGRGVRGCRIRRGQSPGQRSL
ncbi:uncharacterized protein [Primulina huaijiensis]|uniref:uncharacterized protein n=1 Tax=Primulina huaijiensis TaxID=1492673 RepID=UPI003CC71A07